MSRGAGPAAVKRNHLYLSLLVGALALAAYANSFPGSFVLDDVPIVQENPLVRDPDLGAIFSTGYWGEARNTGMYRPLTILSYGINRRLFGPEPFSFHLINVLLHGAVSLLLYRLLTAIPLGAGAAWLAAALFAVHPVHGEVVNEVVGRAELLAAVFTFLGLGAALRRPRPNLPLTMIWYAAALLAKESAMVFIPVLLCLDLFTASGAGKTLTERRRLYLALVAVTAGYLFLRTWVMAQARMPPQLIISTDNPLLGLPVLPRILSALRIQLLYLRHLVFPFPLVGAYSGHFIGRIESVFSWSAVAVLATVFCLVAVGVLGWVRRRGYGIGLAIYFAGFLVNANIIFLAYIAMADRFAYLPSAGYCLAASSLLLALAGGDSRRGLRLLCWAAGLGYLAVLAGSTLSRNPSFANPMSLWEQTVKADPRNGRGWYYLGGLYEQDGRLREAEEAYRKSIEGEPDFPGSHQRYAAFLLGSGRPEEALEHAARTRELHPEGVNPAYITAALALVRLNRPREALDWLAMVEGVYHSLTPYLEARGRALDMLGDVDGAIGSYERVYDRHEVDPEVVLRLAELLLDRKDAVRAEEILRFRAAREGSGEVYNLLGVSLAVQGRPADAVDAFEKAVSLDPGAEAFRKNLERARRGDGGRWEYTR